MSAKPDVRFPRIIAQYCRQRVATAFPPREAGRLEAYLTDCFAAGRRPPRAPRGWAWGEIAVQCGIDPDQLRDNKGAVEPILTSLQRELERAPERKQQRPVSPPRRPGGRPRSINEGASSADNAKGTPTATLDRAPRRGRPPAARTRPSAVERPSAIVAKRHGPARKPRVQAPPALWDAWDDPDSFHEALDLHMRRHGEGSYPLWASIVRPGDTLNKSTIAAWRRGVKAPRSAESLEVLARCQTTSGTGPLAT